MSLGYGRVLPMIPGKPTPSDTRRAVLTGVVLGCVVYGLVVGARGFGILQPYELLAYDLGLGSRSMPAEPSPWVTVIEVTETDIAALGRWPLSDTQLSAALERIGALAPRAIGLDIYRDIEVPPGRAQLDATLTRDDRILAVTKLADSHGPGVPPPATLAGTSRVGFNDVVVDNDGIVRRGLLFMDDGADTAFAFALRVASKYLVAEGIAPAPDAVHPEHIRLGGTTVPPLSSDLGGYVRVDAGGYQFLLDYAQPNFQRYSFGALLADEVPVDAIKDRIVLLGVAADSVKDDFYSPLGGWVWRNPGKMSGIELHAQITDQLLRFALHGQRPITGWSAAGEHLWIFGWALAGALAGLAGRSARRLGLLWIGGSAAVAGGSFVLLIGHIWVPLIPAWLAWLGASGLTTAYLAQTERRQRQMLHDLFATHVSADVATMLWERRAELIEHGSLKSQSVTATTLFVDLRGFTSISEQLAPDELMSWLNRALEAFTRTILDHDGMIDDYFGDGIKASFGVLVPARVPDAVATHARGAVDCARALARVTHELNTRRAPAENPYAIRIGIHTGFVVAGTVGSERRLKFTTIGDAVNLAARLESLEDPRLDANSPCQIVVSESTRAYLSADVPTRAVAAVRLKGKREPITVHQILLEDPFFATTAQEALQP